LRTSQRYFLGSRRHPLVKHEDGLSDETTCPECGKEHVRVYREGGQEHLEVHRVYEYVNGKKTTMWHYCIPGPRDEEI
jgi:hypothetical protein